ncbi:MAG: tetratricopeptide repeat protein [Myxococcota bacterium]
MSDLEKSRARCEAHDMAYDPTVHTGCIVCRREELAAQESEKQTRRVWPFVMAAGFLLIALGGIGIGVYGHKVQEAARVERAAVEPGPGQDIAAGADDEDAPRTLGLAGVDEYGYPNDLPDKLSLLAMLRDKQYRKLTAALESFQDEAKDDFHKERWPSVAFSTFRTANRRLARRFDGWVRSTPKSFVPYLARAEHRMALAERQRAAAQGKPSKKARSRRKKLLSLAADDVSQALALRPEAMEAYALRLAIATERGADVAARAQIVEDAIQHCNHCFDVRAEYLASVTPARGGSHELMKRKAEGWQYVDENPKLRQLLGFADADLCETLPIEGSDRALSHCAEAIRTGPNPRFYASQARVLSELERYEDAIAAFDEALVHSPQDPRLLTARGNARLELEGYDLAAKDLALAVKLDPSNRQAKSDLDQILEKLVRMAYYQAEAGEVEDAIRNYDRVLELQPRYADALAFRGQAYAKKDQLNDAERDLLHAIRIDPANLDAYRGLDTVLSRQERLDEAIAHWNRYLKRRPKDAAALFERSGAYYRKGERDRALQDVKAACKLGNEEACSTQRRFASAP